MEWLKIDEDGEIALISEEIKLISELQVMNTLNYNKQDGDRDGRKKYRLLKELKFMYLVYSPKSPYKDYMEDERVIEAKIDCSLPKSWQVSSELKALIAKYEKGVKNKITRSLKTVEKFLEKFEKHLEMIDLNERNQNLGLIHDPGKIMSTLKQLPDYLLTIQELERQARLDIITSPKSKGDHELGWLAIPQPATKTKSIEDESNTDN